MDNIVIERVNVTKFLGIYVIENLFFIRKPRLSNDLAHVHFSKPDSMPLFRKKIKEFILMLHDTEQ